MGFLMKNGEVRWRWDANTRRGCREIDKIGLKITEAFRNGLFFHKARVSFECHGCGKNKPKRTRYLCNNYNKICSDCALEWIKKSKETMQEIIGMFEDRKVELFENKDKWRKEQILGAIEEGDE